MDKRICEYIDNHREEMLESARELIEIKSIATEGEGEFPFGENSAKALNAALRQFEDAGFKTKNIDNKIAYIDFGGDPYLGVLAHVDIVPADEDKWDYPPFEITEKDGNLYGRGITDDKGPIVCVLYALRAIKEAGISLKKGVRVILGASEETGSELDLKAYEEKEKWPEVVFSPDGDYPVLNFEGGRFCYVGEKKFAENNGSRKIVSIDGGTVHNVIPEHAQAVVQGVSNQDIQGAIKELNLDVKFTTKPQGDNVKIQAEGVSSHVAKPDNAINAVTGLLTLLDQLSFEGELAQAIAGLTKAFPHGDNYGRGSGMYYEEKRSGSTALNLGVIHFDGTKLYVETDYRFPLGKTFAEVFDQGKALMEKLGFTMISYTGAETHYVDEESPIVKTLSNIAGKYMEFDKPCIGTRGGTYVHDIENGVAFGPVRPKNVETDGNNIHGNNEYVNIEDFFANAKIYAEAILEICG